MEKVSFVSGAVNHAFSDPFSYLSTISILFALRKFLGSSTSFPFIYVILKKIFKSLIFWDFIIAFLASFRVTQHTSSPLL